MAGLEIVPAGALQADGGAAAPYEPVRSPDVPETDAEAEAKGPEERALFWSRQISTALVQERRWRSEAEHAETVYFGPDEDPSVRDADVGTAHNPISETTSTVHGNIEVLKPLLFSETPTPIVRRRFSGDGKQPDDTDLMATEAAHRLSQWILSTTAFDDAMEGVRDDWLIAGRGAARAFYKAKFTQAIGPDGIPATVKAEECVYASHWEWRRLVLAPGHSWESMPWIAFEVPMTRTKIESRFPDKAARIAYNRKGLSDRGRGVSDSDRQTALAGTDTTTSGEQTVSPFDTATVWEIWDKDQRKVIWWSPDLATELLGEEGDLLALENFWPMPKPLLATAKGSSLNPRPDVRYYEAAAAEVEQATTKMAGILKVLAVAGVYPGQMQNVVKDLLSGRNAVYPVEAWLSLMDKGGTREMIQWLPLEAMIQAINALTALREQAKQRMFEASGVSDVMRAQGDPRATATQESIKGKYAGMRLASRQRKMAVYVRDMLRILVEMATEMFDTGFIASICNLDLPMTEAERQAIEMQAAAQAMAFQQQIAAHEQAMAQRQMVEQAAQAQGGQLTLPPPPAPPAPPPEVEIPKTSWELVHARLRSDLSRKITITIETQSTILADEQADKEARVEFMGAMATFIQQIMPMVASGQIDMKAAKELLLFGVRGFPKARTLESMISDLPDEMPQGDSAPDVAVQVAQIRAEVDIEIEKMRMADSEADRQHAIRMKGVEMVADAARTAAEPQADKMPGPPQQPKED